MCARPGGGKRTVDGALEFLPAGTTVELSNARFSVELDGDGTFVIAEEAGKCRRQGIGLRGDSVSIERRGAKEAGGWLAPFSAPWAFATTSCAFPLLRWASLSLVGGEPVLCALGSTRYVMRTPGVAMNLARKRWSIAWSCAIRPAAREARFSQILTLACFVCGESIRARSIQEEKERKVWRVGRMRCCDAAFQIATRLRCWRTPFRAGDVSGRAKHKACMHKARSGCTKGITRDVGGGRHGCMCPALEEPLKALSECWAGA